MNVKAKFRHNIPKCKLFFRQKTKSGVKSIFKTDICYCHIEIHPEYSQCRAVCREDAAPPPAVPFMTFCGN